MKSLTILIVLVIPLIWLRAQDGVTEEEQVWSGESLVPDLGKIRFERYKWHFKHKFLYPDDPEKPSSFVFETVAEPFIRLTIQSYPTKTTNYWGPNPHVYGDWIIETIGGGLGFPDELHHLLKKEGSSKPNLATGEGIRWDAVTPKANKPYLQMVNVHYFETEAEVPWMQVSHTNLSKDEEAVWIVAVTSQAVLLPNVSEYVSFRR